VLLRAGRTQRRGRYPTWSTLDQIQKTESTKCWVRQTRRPVRERITKGNDGGLTRTGVNKLWVSNWQSVKKDRNMKEKKATRHANNADRFVSVGVETEGGDIQNGGGARGTKGLEKKSSRGKYFGYQTQCFILPTLTQFRGKIPEGSGGRPRTEEGSRRTGSPRGRPEFASTTATKYTRIGIRLGP